MKKIPTLFEREYANHKVVGVRPVVTHGMEWVLEGDGDATVKIDGACCAIIGGVFYKRYDAKKGKNPPLGAISCCDPDPVTGHWPNWVPIESNNPSDKWFVEALKNTPFAAVGTDYTYEAVGPHFQGNPYNLHFDTLIPHGLDKVAVVRTFDGIRDYLKHHNIEGLVFWKDGEPKCKIKRSDFGFSWPEKDAATSITDLFAYEQRFKRVE